MCAIAFAELVAYIEDVLSEEGIVPAIKLVDLAKLYQDRFYQLEVSSVGGQVHTTRLKCKLLAAIPDLSTHSEGRGILLIFDEDVGGALKQACTQDSRAANLARERQRLYDETCSDSSTRSTVDRERGSTNSCSSFPVGLG